MNVIILQDNDLYKWVKTLWFQSFERVVVQNILHGCSPSLCKAIQSVPRWKVIQAAFPHVMHACSTLLTSCKCTNIGKGLQFLCNKLITRKKNVYQDSFESLKLDVLYYMYSQT